MGCVRGLFQRERDGERRTLALRAFCHNGSAVPISNFPADGGTIVAKSAEGEGATFIVTLPLKQPSAAAHD